MTERGANAQIPAKVIIVTGTNAFAKSSFIMCQKIANILSIVSFVLVSSVIGGGYFGYKYVTSEQFQNKMINKVLEGVQGMMPKVLEKGLPDLTGPSLPVPPKGLGI